MQQVEEGQQEILEQQVEQDLKDLLVPPEDLVQLEVLEDLVDPEILVPPEDLAELDLLEDLEVLVLKDIPDLLELLETLELAVVLELVELLVVLEDQELLVDLELRDHKDLPEDLEPRDLLVEREL